MNAGLKPYSSMKDSGVAWLGRVPAHWSALSGRACFRENNRANFDLREKTVLSLSYGQIKIKPPEKLHGLVPVSFESYQIVNPLEIIVRPTDLQNDKVSLRFGLSRHRGIITSAYLCLRTIDSVMSKFGYLLLHAYDLKKMFYGLGSGLRQNLDWTDFKNLPCFVPPPLEQAAIVRFLDHADRRIRRYIRAKEKLIALLEEQKQAIVHQAVTGRIDVRTGQPYPAYKPSGVEWLGNIPAHWEVRRLRSIAEMRVSNVDKLEKDDERAVRLCNYTDVYKNDRIQAGMPFMRATATADEIKRFRLHTGDVLITKDSEAWNDIGVSSLVESTANDLVSGYHLALLRPITQKVSGAYLHRALSSAGIADQFYVGANGVTRYGLSQNAIKSVCVPIGPFCEQTAIVCFLDETIATIDDGVARARRQMHLLREYRTRLIADVVTGKLDVREAAAALPEVDPLAADDAAEGSNNAGEERAFEQGQAPTEATT